MTSDNMSISKVEKVSIFNPKSTGLFPPGAALGGVFHPLCKIRSKHPRKLKFTGLIAYVSSTKYANLKA